MSSAMLALDSGGFFEKATTIDSRYSELGSEEVKISNSILHFLKLYPYCNSFACPNSVMCTSFIITWTLFNIPFGQVA